MWIRLVVAAGRAGIEVPETLRELTSATPLDARLEDAALSLLDHLAAASRGVVVIDDVHRADTVTLELLVRLAATPDGLPVLLVLTLSSAEDHPDPRGRRALAWLANTERHVHLDAAMVQQIVDVEVADVERHIHVLLAGGLLALDPAQRLSITHPLIAGLLREHRSAHTQELHLRIAIALLARPLASTHAAVALRHRLTRAASWDRLRAVAASAGAGGSGRLTAEVRALLAPDAEARLTLRQVTVLRRLADGRTYEEIAAELGFAHGTIRKDAIALYRALEAVGRDEAVAIARGVGLVPCLVP